jgi:adenylosuccinate lyase
VISRYTRSEMANLWSDETRYRRWLEVELLAVEAYEQLGRFPPGTAARLRERATVSSTRVDELEAEYRHDMIAFIAAVSETVDPDDARAIHFGLTSTDVVDTALASVLVEALDLVLAGVDRVRERCRALALKHRDTPAVGRTHGIHAEPTSFGLRWALYWLEFGRHRDRLAHARAQMAVGKISGAVGHYANVPPEVEQFVCRRLGLTPAPLSTQVLQRDRHAEVVAALAILASSIDKCATEIRHLQRTEVGEAEEPFGRGQRGSSAMPHKKNPVSSEQLSGLARLMRGYVVPALEDIPLWHERDISHSSVERVMLPDATALAHYMLHHLARILDGLTVHPDRMLANLERGGGLVYSQRVLLALVDRGLPRGDAYGAVQAAAMAAMRQGGGSFRAELQADPRVAGLLGDEDWDRLFDWRPYLRHVPEIYRRIGIENPA